jgi:hypothetical protein
MKERIEEFLHKVVTPEILKIVPFEKERFAIPHSPEFEKSFPDLFSFLRGEPRPGAEDLRVGVIEINVERASESFVDKGDARLAETHRKAGDKKIDPRDVPKETDPNVLNFALRSMIQREIMQKKKEKGTPLPAKGRRKAGGQYQILVCVTDSRVHFEDIFPDTKFTTFLAEPEKGRRPKQIIVVLPTDFPLFEKSR